MTYYFDNNSTTRPDGPELHAAGRIVEWEFGNPSSDHIEGEFAFKQLEKARETIAATVNCRPEELALTSGGTESNCLALNCSPEIGDIVIAPNSEHSSVYNCAVEKTLTLPSGQLDLNSLEDTLKKLKSWVGKKTVAAAHANNETGVINPLEEVFNLCQQYGAQFHVDAVASWHKIPVDVRDIKCDTLSISFHKNHGLKGAGALYVREGVKVEPLFKGGSHERGYRPGTQNILAAVQMGLVCETWAGRLLNTSALRDRLESKLAHISVVNGDKERRVGSTSNLYFPAVKDLDLFLMMLSDRGLMCSGKSACSSGMPSPSRVLQSMYGEGAPQLNGSIRLSLSKLTTEEEVDSAADIIKEIVEKS